MTSRSLSASFISVDLCLVQTIWVPNIYFVRYLMFQYLGTLWIVLTNLFDVDLPIMMDKRIICVIVLLSQGIKAILDWLRLFDSTSFYVTLI